MKKVLLLLSMILLGLSLSTSAYACGFHSDFDTPSPYGWTFRTYDDSNVDYKPVEKEKPVFSSAASRASDLAKAKVKNENVKKNSDKQESKESTSNKESESKASL